MDDLENLPLSDEEEEEESPVQQKVMKKYFGNKSKASGDGGWKDTSKWKIIGASVAAFLLLSNPWVLGMLQKIPYLGGNNMTELLASSVMFLVLMISIVFFL